MKIYGLKFFHVFDLRCWLNPRKYFTTNISQITVYLFRAFYRKCETNIPQIFAIFAIIIYRKFLESVEHIHMDCIPKNDTSKELHCMAA